VAKKNNAQGLMDMETWRDQKALKRILTLYLVVNDVNKGYKCYKTSLHYSLYTQIATCLQFVRHRTQQIVRKIFKNRCLFQSKIRSFYTLNDFLLGITLYPCRIME